MRTNRFGMAVVDLGDGPAAVARRFDAVGLSFSKVDRVIDSSNSSSWDLVHNTGS